MICRHSYDRKAFTLIELLVVIAILGLLFQLMLPAILASREAASKLSCTNNLKQIATAVQLHHDSHRHLPTGGWHFFWTGEPELGFGPEQPGGWIYNSLPYLEQQALRDLGKGLSGSDRAIEFGKRFSTPLPVFHCPSRRSAETYFTGNRPIYYSRDGQLPIEYPEGAKTDFAACVRGWSPTTDFFDEPEPEEGDFFEALGWEPPQSLAEAEDPDFFWPDEPEFKERYGYQVEFDGAIHFRSKVRYAEVTDGLSNTYLIGEKYLEAIRYETGDDPGDNENMYTGFNDDINRSAFFPPLQDAGDGHFDQFGSPHPGSWNMAFADGSVRAMSYDVFLEVHRRLGSRNDGKLVSPDEF